MSEQRTISITAYRDQQGRPTCCSQWPDKHCVFLGTRKMGAVFVCKAHGVDLDSYEALGCLMPASGCIVWGQS